MKNLFQKGGALTAVLILAAIIRIIFVVGAEQIPVMWDARIYSSAAIGLLHYVEHPDRFGHSEKLNSTDSTFYLAQFEHEMKETISGEQIDWLYYDVPNIRQAQDYLFISGPVYPIYLATIFALSPAHDFGVVRILNIAIDLMILYFLMLIAIRLFNYKTGIIAGLIYSIYLPFILYTGLISPDPLTALFTILAFYFVLKYYDRAQRVYLCLTGLTLGLLILTRSTAMLLFVPFLIGFIYDQRGDLKKLSGRIIMALIPFILVVSPWVIITSLHYDQIAIRDPGYSEANFRSSSSIINEGYDLDYTEKDFWTTSVSEQILGDIPGYSKLLLKKFVRLWGHPYNDYQQTFIMTPAISRLFHLAIIFTAFWSVLLFLIRREKGYIFLLLIPAYYTLLHIIFHSLARYNFNSMPVMIIASSFVLIKLFGYFKGFSLSHNLRMVLPFLVGIAILLFIPIKSFVSIIGPEYGSTIGFICKLIVLTALLIMTLRMLSESLGANKALKLSLAPAIIIFIIFSVLGNSQSDWSEWKIRLDKTSQMVGIKIYPPKDFRLKQGEKVRACFDLTTNRDLKNPTNLYFNGQIIPIYLNRPPYDIYYTRKTTYPAFDGLLDYGKEKFRAWRYVPLKAEIFNSLMDQFGVIDISVMQADNLYEPDAYIDMYGSFILSDDSLLMPSLSRRSIERFVEKEEIDEKGDPRICVNYKISSDSTISYYIDNVDQVEKTSDDLSDQFGKQTGRYRIFLEVKKLNETRLYF